MKIAVIGTGYVGLVTGVGLSEFGMTVACVDIDKEKIANLSKGKIPIYEPGLDVILQRNIRQNRLFFTDDISSAVAEAQVIFIAVGTPSAEDGSVDMGHFFAAAESVATALNSKPSASLKVIVVKSTVPVGASRRLKTFFEERIKKDIKFAVVSNPEFLREGSAVEDFLRPDRVIVGSENDEATAIIKEIYDPLYLIQTPFVIANYETSELIKYATNAFLAAKVSFINEMANFCDRAGADVHTVAHGIGIDGRIGRKFLHPGPGFGGSCLPKDARALVRIGREQESPFKIVEAALEVNARQASEMIKKIESLLGSVKGKTIGVLGLSFKPNTDDVRESPALRIVDALKQKGAKIKAYDPAAMPNAKKIIPDITYCDDPYETVSNAHALVLLTEWNEFRKLDLERIKKSMAEQNFADLRNVYEPDKVRSVGFRYISVGRTSVK